MYRYRLVSMHESSRKYGDCEVCHQPVSEVFLQIEQRAYTDEEGKQQFTLADCRDFFGHEQCLLNARRQPLCPNS